jgi:uncharacterized damage-inducible protein DinB
MDVLPALALLQTGWPTYQGHLVRAVAPLTTAQLDLRLSPDLRSIRVQVAHIIAARAYWYHRVMGEGPAEIKPLSYWDDEGQPAWTTPDLVNGLELTWAVVAEGLDRYTPPDLAQTFPRPSNPSQARNRQWIVWHVLEHDLHHGGELSFVLGAHSLPGIDL